MQSPGTTNDPYTHDEGKAYHEAIHGGLNARGYDLVARRRARKIQPFVGASDAVLEYGVGPGWNLARLHAGTKRGYDVSAVMRPLVEKQGIAFAEQLTAQDEQAYDTILCSHVLEHLDRPSDALDEIYHCLKPGGTAVFFVPMDTRRKFNTYDAAEPNHHLYNWNVQSLCNLAARHGFVIREGYRRRFGYERIAAVWAGRLGLPEWAYSLALAIILGVTREYEAVAVVTRPGETAF